MRALSFSRLMFVLGLTLGVIVLLAGLSPTVLNANSLTGGAWPTCPGGPCFVGTDGTEDCSQAQNRIEVKIKISQGHEEYRRTESTDCAYYLSDKSQHKKIIDVSHSYYRLEPICNIGYRL